MEKVQSRTHCDDSLVKCFHNIRKWKKGSDNNQVMEEKETINKTDNVIKKTRGRN